MSSPNPEFPGEDFFHPGFTPAGFSPKLEPPGKETPGKHQPQQQQPRSQNVIPRRPVPSPRNSTTVSPAEKATAPALGLGLDRETEIWPREGTPQRPETVTTAGTGGEVNPEPSKAPALYGSRNTLSAGRSAKSADEISAPSSVYGESGLPSASPSHPSPPPPWPASPHVQRDYAFSQLHGGAQLLHAHPVSPISDSEHFSSRDASRSNSLAYRVSQRTLPRSIESSVGRRDAPLPPLPRNSQASQGSSGKPELVSDAVRSPLASQGYVGGAAHAPESPAQVAGASSPQQQPVVQDSPDGRGVSLKNDWPLGHHTAVGALSSQDAANTQNKKLQLPFQLESVSPVHVTPSQEFYTPQASVQPARFSTHQQPTPQRNSQQAFSQYMPSPQQRPRLSHQNLSQQAAFSPDRASVQGGQSPMHRRAYSQPALHPLQQHPPLAHCRTPTVGGSGETPFMQQYEDGSVFGPTMDTSGLKEEEAELGRGRGLTGGGASAAGPRRLSEQTRRSGAASAHSVWGGFRASWLPEVLWCLVAVACLGIIGVLLSRYDGQALATWPLPITLNALIAFLVSVCHAALIFPVLEGLGQLKWNWFARHDRSLADFQAFEDARRGPVGVLRLAFVTKGRCLSLLAAIIMLTSVVTSPLTQMMIEYPTRLGGGNSQASLFARQSYSFADIAGAPNPVGLDTRQKQSIQLGIYNPADTEMAPLPPNCGSKECQSETFNSLSVCSRTNDITSHLRVSDPIRVSRLPIYLNLPRTTFVRNASLPNGVYLVGSVDTYNFNMSAAASSQEGSTSLPGASSLSFADQPDLMGAAISNFFIIYTNSTGQSSPKVTPNSNGAENDGFDDRESQAPVSFRAVEVLLHFCVGTYEVQMDKSGSSRLLRTVRTSTSTEIIPQEQQQQQQPKSMLMLAARPGVAAAASNYSIDPEAVRLLSDYMASAFSGTYSASMGTRAVGYSGTGDAFGSAIFGVGASSALQQAVMDGSAEEKQSTADDKMRRAVGNVTQNVATSLTNTIRSLGATEPSRVLGAAETFVSVRWGWLAVLAAQVLLSAAFLAGVAVQTSWQLGVPVIKASGGLATLLAVSSDDRRILEREGIGRLDEGRIMAPRLDADGIRGRFSADADADRGWSMDLGVRIHEVRPGA